MYVYKSSVHFRIWFRLRISVTFFDEIYAWVFLSHHPLCSLSVVGFSKLTHSVSVYIPFSAHSPSRSASYHSFTHAHACTHHTQAHMRNVSVEYNRRKPKKPKKKILINFRPDSFSFLEYVYDSVMPWKKNRRQQQTDEMVWISLFSFEKVCDQIWCSKRSLIWVSPKSDMECTKMMHFYLTKWEFVPFFSPLLPASRFLLSLVCVRVCEKPTEHLLKVLR